MTTSILSTATSSSSATTCAIAMSSDCPVSILPKNAVTRPSAPIATQESSSVGSSGGLPAEAPWASASPMKTGPAAVTISAPEALRNSRRESGAFMVVSLGQLRLGALDRAQDRHVRSAAALQAGERVAQPRLARLGVFVVAGRGGHDPAVEAFAALRHLLLHVRRLQRVRLLGRAQPLQRRALLARDRRDRHDAGAHRLAVEVHRARAALREPAAEVR